MQRRRALQKTGRFLEELIRNLVPTANDLHAGHASQEQRAVRRFHQFLPQLLNVPEIFHARVEVPEKFVHL